MAVVRRGSGALVRDLNRSAILSMIGREGPIARAEIARRLGLSPATVTKLTRTLIDQGLIRVVDRAPSRGGRPALLLRLVPSAACAFGVKIAADHLVGVRVNLDAEVLEQFEEPFDAAGDDVVTRLAAILRPRLAAARRRDPVLLGVGLGVPGVVHPGDGVVDSPVLGWRQLHLGERLGQALRIPVLVDNDVNTLAVAERLYGAGRDIEDFLTVTLGRGVGLGLVVHGDVYRGVYGGAGEFGHVPVVEDGPRCECGKHGCLEAFVSDPALERQAREQGLIREHQGVDALRALAENGDVAARRIYARAGAALGRAVGGLVNILDPGLLIVSGEGTQAWAHLAREFEHELRSSALEPLRDVPVEVDPWDDAKWARGAAALVLRATLVPALHKHHPDAAVQARLAAASAGQERTG